MKYLLLICIAFLPVITFSQVTILDSNIAYDSLSSQYLLTVFLSPPVSNADLSTLQGKVGNAYGASDVLNTDYTIGDNVSVEYNQLQVPLSGISVGEYVSITLTRSDASTQVMEYRTQ